MIWNFFSYGTSRALVQSESAKQVAKQAEQSAQFIEFDLASRIDHLSLVCRAMWEILRDSHGVSEDMLLTKVREIDLRDGKLDGKYLKEVRKCTKCQRVMNPRHFKCIYCGEEALVASAFDRV